MKYELTKGKRLLSLLLAVSLLLGCVPLGVFAEEMETAVTEETAVPTEENAAPTEETAVPTEETAVPTEETAVPTEETTEPTEETTEPAEETAAPTEAASLLLAEDNWDHIHTDALCNKISVTPGQLVGETGEVVENEIYGYVANYPLKKGHVLSISDEGYVFSVRKLENGNYSNMLKAADTTAFTAKEDMTVAMLIRKPDKAPVTAEELTGVVIYDSQFGMIGVEGSVHRFTVEAKTIEGGTATTRAAIFLPPSYSEGVTPTRLIVMTNGYHAHLTDSVWNKNTADNVGIIRSYLNAGYAVYVVDNTANGQVGTPDLGCPQLISSYWEAYDYIQKHFHVEKKISIHSRSFGTFAAVGLMRSCPDLIKCALLTGPRISFAREWKSVDKAFVAKRFGFADTTGAVYEADKLVGFDPYTDVDAGDYFLPPTYWIMSQGDATGEPLTVIEKLKALGNDVQSITHTGTDHTGVCTLNTEAMFADALAYLDAHQQETAPEETVSFAGKTLSILGASTATYEGVSNDTEANSTIGDNDVYYTEGRHGVYLKDTWWQQVIDALDMELLVNNSWSGSCVFMPRKGAASVGYGDRAVNLHNDHTGREPEVILIYIGGNDFAYYPDTFGTAAEVCYDALIPGHGSYAEPQTTCEAYAILLHKVQNRYPNAKIYCMTSAARRDPDYPGDSYPDAGQPTAYNAELAAVAERFGFPVIDLEQAIPKEAAVFDTLMGDKRAHPNALGMDRFTNQVLTVLLGKKTEICHVTSQQGIVREQAVLLGGSYSAEAELPEGAALTVTMEGRDITEEVYRNGTILIPRVTGDISVSAEIRREPMHFAWEMVDGALLSVGSNENPLHPMWVTTPDGWPAEYSYRLEHFVHLRHDLPWSVEWKCEGDWRGTVLAEAYSVQEKGISYLSRTKGGQLCFGSWTGSQYDNYGVDISWLDDGVHTYRLENCIAADGSNMVWLFVDELPLGPMNNYFVGSNDQHTTSPWISGKDFTFFYIGTETNKIRNCALEYLEIRERGQTHAVPENRGVANAIARAYALTDVEWTPKRDVPGVQKIDGEFTVVPFEAGATYRGIPYSGTIATDTYVGLNVSLESFLTALENENSVLYTENLFSTNPKSASYFGTVCSKFAQYVLDVPGSYNTNNVASIPGMQTLALPGKYTVKEIRLGDVILDVVNHTAVCTGILHDENGEVTAIEISEAVMPLVRRLWWTPEEFYSRFDTYRLCRYDGIGEVPPAPQLQSSGGHALMPRMGDRYNYTVSSTPGIVDILDSSCQRVTILRDGQVIRELELNGEASFTFDRSVPGMLEMQAFRSDGTSDSVYACVVEASVQVTNTESFADGKLEVTFRGSSGTPLYVQVGSGQNVFCSVEGAENSAWLYFSPGKVSNQKVRVAYQNEFGIYLSPWVGFTADINPSQDPLLSQGQYWDGCNITPGSHIPAQQTGKEDYWAYTDVPVEGNAVYYSEGATRLWFLDKDRDPISTMNAYKDSQVPFQFTTPEHAAYVSIAYSPNLVEKGTERLEKLSSCYRLEVPAREVWIDGVRYAALQDEKGSYILLEGTDAKIMTVYSCSDPAAEDVHTQYPTAMQVWRLRFENGGYTVEALPELENALQYAGSSIRVKGVKGIRMITAIPKTLRGTLMSGTLGYTLKEYGTAVTWAAEGVPVLGKGHTMSNFAYRQDVADPIFADTGDAVQFTNVLVGFTDDQLARDLILRPYMILEDSEGQQLTIYGGCIQRSIGYIAKQNQETFPTGSKADAYIEDIISKVYT